MLLYQHPAMGDGGGNVLPVQRTVEVNGGINPLHQRVRSTGVVPTPHGVRSRLLAHGMGVQHRAAPVILNLLEAGRPSGKHFIIRGADETVNVLAIGAHGGNDAAIA